MFESVIMLVHLLELILLCAFQVVMPEINPQVYCKLVIKKWTDQLIYNILLTFLLLILLCIVLQIYRFLFFGGRFCI